MYDVLIIGCGVVGAAVAREFSKYNISLAVLEAQNDVAMGQTKANSAIIHAGYDPETGTKMAKLNVFGNELTAKLCKKLNVSFKRIGSLVVAFDEYDQMHVSNLFSRGSANGIKDLEIWSREKCLKEEPALSNKVKCALYAPSAGIINPWEYALALAQTAVKNGADIYFDSFVTSIKKEQEYFKVSVLNGSSYYAKYIINAAGVHSDEIASMVSDNAVKIVPTKGEYYLLDKSQGTLVNHIIFQCPTEKGKGVLVAPTIHGNLIVGPNAEYTKNKNDTSTSASGLDYVAKMALKSVPDINFKDNIRNFSGVRANTLDEDFIIGESNTVKGFFNLAGIKSPGLTAAAAIAKEIVQICSQSGVVLERKDNFINERKVVSLKSLTADEKNKLISSDPKFGRVICRCETVTEGEIIAALSGVLPAHTVDGVKRRTNAGMGRCQGGFCSSRIVEIISSQLGIDPCEVLQDAQGSVILTKSTKSGDTV